MPKLFFLLAILTLCCTGTILSQDTAVQAMANNSAALPLPSRQLSRPNVGQDRLPDSRRSISNGRKEDARLPIAQAFGDIAVIEDNGAIVGDEKLFDLDNTTLQFTPLSDGGYRVAKIPLVWESDTGAEVPYDPGFPVQSREVPLSELAFSFGNRAWQSMVINSTGNITFGWREDETNRDRYFLFDDLANIFVSNGDVMIAPSWHRFLRSPRSRTFFKSHNDRVVVTWDVTERFADPIFFLRTPNRNQIQVVLFPSGEIRLSYNGVQTRDGIVGVFPGVTPIATRTLSINTDTQDPGTEGYLDILEARVEQVDTTNVRFSYDLREPVPEPKQGLVYRFFIDTDPPFQPGGIDFDAADCVVSLHISSEGDWEARHCAGLGSFDIDGNRISVLLPLAAIDFAEQFKWFGDAVDFNTTGQFDQIDTLVASPTDFGADRAIDLSNSLPIEVGAGAVFESFHYALLSDPRTITNAFYRSFEDEYDFLVLLTNFRFAGQEAAPAGFGALNTAVEGIGLGFDGVEAFGSDGRLQSGQLPSWIHAPVYDEQGADNTGLFRNYDRAMSLISHEIGHRWLANLDFMDSGVRRPLHDSAPHWLTNVPTARSRRPGVGFGRLCLGNDEIRKSCAAHRPTRHPGSKDSRRQCLRCYAGRRTGRLRFRGPRETGLPGTSFRRRRGARYTCFRISGLGYVENDLFAQDARFESQGPDRGGLVHSPAISS